MVDKRVISYFLVFALIVGFVNLGSSKEKKAQLNSVSAGDSSHIEKNQLKDISLVNDVVETSVVARLAESANLAVAPNSANLSVSVAVLQDAPTSQDAIGVVEKPKVLEVESNKRDIVKYTTTEEETIQSVADKYGITSQTVKWVNKIKGDKIEAGKEIKIIPVDGIVYSVKPDDNIEEISKKYEADYERVLSYNGLVEGKVSEEREIVIPGGILPEKERPDYVEPVVQRIAPRSVTRQSSGTSPQGVVVNNPPSAHYNVKAGNAYAFGNCTWYVYNRRPDIGSFWGNAASWGASARAAGYRVDGVPAPGAIAQWNAFAGGSWGWGHVGLVESVNSDGTITISEMNYAGGFNRVSYRTIPASSVSNYIH